MTLKRSMVPILKHKLINKKLSQLKSPPEKLNTHIQMKDLKVTSEHDKDKFLKELKLQNNFVYVVQTSKKTLFSTLSNIIYTDLKTTPNLSLPAILRKKIPNYPYASLWSVVNAMSHLPGAKIIEHFEEMHQAEPDWQCTKCDKTFDAICLSDSGWIHDCS
ncbi:hypothetical protein ACJJTC_010022 [Scirpophaga incertulas]